MRRNVILALMLVTAFSGSALAQPAEPDLMRKAEELAREFIVIDTHIDIPYRMTKLEEDISKRTARGHFDYPRAVEGGLDVAFMSIYIPASYQKTDYADAFADTLIDMVEGFAENAPEKFAVATSTEEVRANFKKGVMSLPLGMENGAPITELDKLEYFYDRGIRYITLTHSRVNQISDSSYDTTRTWGGLSPYGENVVREMNRLGIMVDISHVTDSAFYDVLQITDVPVITSHSSARHFTPGFERNMSDDMIRALAENGGVIQINFGSSFITEEANRHGFNAYQTLMSEMEAKGIDPDSDEGQDYVEAYFEANPSPTGDVADVADHFDHVVALVGIDHVGLGSDYDGVSTLPEGLEDASTFPNLFAELLSRGYSEADIRKIAGENLLRVWEDVEQAAEMN